MGGSSPSGETKYTWNEDLGPRWNNLLNMAPWATGMMDAQGRLQIPDRQQFTGERFAPLSYDQNTAGSNIRSLNDGSFGTISVGNNARKELDKTLTGGYSNPYIGGNPHANQNTVTDRNLFAGNNPYFRDMVNQSLEDTTNAYQRGTAADTKSAFTRAGVFGGSAHENAVANNEAALGKTLSNQVNSLMNAQFDRSAGLEDSYLGRDLQNQQFNRSTSSGLMENQLNRGMQGWDAERNRQMGAVGQAQNEQGMALQRAGAQMDVGGMFQGQDQKYRDFQFDQWNQNAQHPFQLMDWYSGLLGRAQGGMAPNSQVYQGGGGAGQYAGAALGLASLFA
jgi:hypothetical protein